MILATQRVKASAIALTEQPPNAASWKRMPWTAIKRLCPYGVTVLGCQVGLRDNDGELMSKKWKLHSNSRAIRDYLGKFSKCTCPRGASHGPCQGDNRATLSEHVGRC